MLSWLDAMACVTLKSLTTAHHLLRAQAEYMVDLGGSGAPRQPDSCCGCSAPAAA